MPHLMSGLTSKSVFPLALAFAGVLALSACVSDPDDGEPTPPPAPVDRQQLIDTGDYEFMMNCTGCHGTEGEGGRGPRLNNSSYVMGSKERLVSTVLAGLESGDTIFVNGVPYQTGGMPHHWDLLSDLQAAAILTYIRVVLNDSLYTNCVTIDEFSAECDVNPRDSLSIATDSISVEMVTHIRDSLELGYPPTSAKTAARLR